MGGLDRCGHFYGGYMHGLGILKGGQDFAAFAHQIEGPPFPQVVFHTFPITENFSKR